MVSLVYLLSDVILLLFPELCLLMMRDPNGSFLETFAVPEPSALALSGLRADAAPSLDV
jgi:hypothetical protein